MMTTFAQHLYHLAGLTILEHLGKVETRPLRLRYPSRIVLIDPTFIREKILVNLSSLKVLSNTRPSPLTANHSLQHTRHNHLWFPPASRKNRLLLHYETLSKVAQSQKRPIAMCLQCLN